MNTTEKAVGKTGWQSPVSSFILKIAAVITMLIDHFAASFMSVFYTPEKWGTYRLLRHIGRFAFPVYCFLLAEGFRYTRNRRKYLGYLLLFALISEIPFDLALENGQIDWSYQNAFWTLALGLLGMIADDEIARRGKISQIPAPVIVILRVIPMGVCVYIAEIFSTDYGAWGVLLVALIYYFEEFIKFISARFDRSEKIPQIALNIAAACAVLNWFLCYDLSRRSWIEIYGLPCVMMILLYNGQRGNYKLLSKWFFYAFYPVHLTLLYLIRLLTLGA